MKISVDAENISCCAFGGENMDELFITSAINDNGEGGELFGIKQIQRVCPHTDSESEKWKEKLR